MFFLAADTAPRPTLLYTLNYSHLSTTKQSMPLDQASKRLAPQFQRLEGSMIKTIAARATPASISLAGGIPHESTFVFRGVAWDMADGSTITLKNRTLTGGTEAEDGAADLPLNYMQGTGMPELREELMSHMRRYHTPAYDEWAVIPTTGSTDALTKCFQLFMPPPGKKPIILAEALVWAAVLAIAAPLGYEVRGLDLDSDGMLPSALDAACLQLAKEGEQAAFLYLTPHGQNPTGTSLSTERKQALYALAQKHDLLIVEDDPYRLLFLPADPEEVAESAMPGLEGLPKSLLSLDADGRVIHLESLSKWVCPGLRLGWLTGPKGFVEGAYRKWNELTIQFACTVSQSVFCSLLKQWGHDGLDAHLRQLQAHYARQRRAMHHAAEKHLRGLATWDLPKAGMFVLFKVAALKGKGKAEAEAVLEGLLAEDVLMVPGYAFDPSPGKDAEPAFRATFATASPEKIEEGIARFGRALARLTEAMAATKKREREEGEEEVAAVMA